MKSNGLQRRIENAYFVTEAKRCVPCTILDRYEFKGAVRVRLDVVNEEIVTTSDRIRMETFAEERRQRADEALREVAEQFKEMGADEARWTKLAQRLKTSVIGVVQKIRAAKRRGYL